MSRHIIKCIFTLLCAFTGLGELGTANSATAITHCEQFVVVDSMPTIGRRAEVSISFTATKSLTSVVKQVTFFAPEDVSIGSVRIGNMPVCKVANALPSNHFTCVSGRRGHDHFAFAPIDSIFVRFAVDTAKLPGALPGPSRLAQRCDGAHHTASCINAQPNPTIDDDMQHQRQKREVGSFVAMGVLALSLSAQAFHGWSLPAIPLGQTPFAISVQGGNSP